jgi:hypothetical protein
MTLTPARIAAGWLPHDGGDCPVPADSRPQVMYRDGAISSLNYRAGQRIWGHSPSGRPCHYDILAYLPENEND